MFNPYLVNQNYPTIPNYQSYPYRLAGKMIGNVNEIMANDVPMDGNIAIFPKNDLSEIYIKRWNADGTISTMHYNPVQRSEINLGTNTSLEEIKAKMGEFESRMADIESRMPKKREMKE